MPGAKSNPDATVSTRVRFLSNSAREISPTGVGSFAEASR